jgi:phosphoribosyl-AMP cyclohydrolase
VKQEYFIERESLVRGSLLDLHEVIGHYQKLHAMRFDCDSLLCLVEQAGAVCHTGRKDCFYFDVDVQQHVVSIRSSIP